LSSHQLLVVNLITQTNQRTIECFPSSASGAGRNKKKNKKKKKQAIDRLIGTPVVASIAMTMTTTATATVPQLSTTERE
jgi:hypothetical protein